MVKMYIKFVSIFYTIMLLHSLLDQRHQSSPFPQIDSQPQTNRHEYFSFLFHQGIGTMVADLYLAWAYYFEAVGSFAKADEIYKMGLGARAQSLEMLKHAQTQLHIMAAEGVRCQGDEEYNSKLLAHMGERRFALTSLRGQTKMQVVGSLRTDAAVKSRTPGLVLQSNAQAASSNVGPVQILPDAMEESSAGLANTSVASQMKSVVDSAIKAQENICEPGPWSQCGQAKGATKKQGSLFTKKEIASEPGFEICEDSLDGSQLDEEGTTSEDLPKLQLPTGFVRHNEPQDDWQVPMTIPEESKAVPMYIKKFVYPPALPQEYSLEEVRTYKWWAQRMIRPDDVRVLREMDSFMGAINLPADFTTQNQPQTPFNVECYAFGPEDKGQPMCRVLSATNEDRHKTFEDLLKERFLAAARERRENKRHAPTIVVDGSCMELDDMDVEEEEGDVKPPAEESPPRTSDTPFGFNESCSTQIFNLFIKPQSISTPNRGKAAAGGGGGGRDKQSSAVPRSSLSLYRTTQQQQQQMRDEIILESSMEDRAQTTSKSGVSSFASPFPGQQQQQPLRAVPSAAANQQQNTSPDQLLHYGGKQLSVIMETTESSASSAGCHTTTTDATITKCGDTRFGASSSSSSSSASSTIDYGVLSLTAKPRKSILKRPEVSVVEVPESPPQAEQFTIFEDDEPEVAQEVKKGNDPFLVPSVPPASNVSVYREAMDFFGAPPPPPQPKMNEFAMPLPPKPKTFMPLYNDSMEQFMEKAKTVPRIPIVSEDANGAAIGNNSLFAEESIFSQMPEREESIVAVPAMPDFSIFHDSMMGGGGAAAAALVKEKSVLMGAIPKDRSRLLGMSAKENLPNISLSPLKSFMQQNNRSAQHNNSDDSGSLFDSPHKKSGGGGGMGRSKDAIYGTSTESTMPTIAAIDPLLLESSLTFPSMRDITTTTNTTMDGRKVNNQSIFSKMQQQQQSMIMPPLLMEESMTFNTLMTREGGDGNKAKASASFNPNLSILALQKELLDDNDFMAPPTAPQTFDESMTFNSLMRKEKGLPAIIGGVESLRFEANAEPTTNVPKPKLLNDSITFNSLLAMKKSEKNNDDDLFLKPPTATANPNQSTFPMELPSSTAHGFSIFTNKNAFTQDDHAMRMEQSISPIPSLRHEEMDDLLQADEEEKEKEPQQEDIYKWENTLRVLPEEDEPDRDSWYNANLDVTAAADQQRKNKNKSDGNAGGDRPKRIGDREYVDPFDADLINNFLASVDFVNYVHKLNECDMKETIPPLRQGGQLELCEQVFSVRKLIGKGAFGQIYSAKAADGRLVALKQSRPCNLWEYYICMEVKFRLKEFNEDLVSN